MFNERHTQKQIIVEIRHRVQHVDEVVVQEQRKKTLIRNSKRQLSNGQEWILRIIRHKQMAVM